MLPDWPLMPGDEATPSERAMEQGPERQAIKVEEGFSVFYTIEKSRKKY